jgi:hypothetical protein
LLRQLKESKCMDRIFFISSTVSSNLKLLQDLDIKEYDIYDPEDPDCIASPLGRRVSVRVKTFPKVLIFPYIGRVHHASRQQI